MSALVVNASAACFPGYTPEDAMAALAAGIEEPVMGRLSLAQVQLCPQNHGQLTEDRLQALMTAYPETTFRLHANVRLGGRQPQWAASDVGSGSQGYFEALGCLSRQLGAPAYTLHAGRRESATLSRLRENLKVLEDWMGLPVGVEGLYPARRSPWLVDTWAEYRWLMDAGVRFAVDLSHLNIVARHERTVDQGLVADLLACPRCLEVHVSGNDGRRDAHRVPTDAPWWYPLLESAVQARPGLVVFSEGNQLRS